MRPDPQLFLHVLGAIALFGATGAAATLAWAARRGRGQVALASATFRVLLFVGLPAWLCTFAFGSWTSSREHWPAGTRWLEVGSGIATVGVFVLLAATGLAYAWVANPARSWPATAVATLTTGYLVALGVAWWLMSAKPAL
jgi:hypothetical protein